MKAGRVFTALLAVAVVSASEPARAADWKFFGTSADENTIHYYDAQSLEKNGHTVRVWEKRVVHNSKAKKDIEFKDLVSYHCGRRTYTIHYIVLYYKPGLSKTYRYPNDEDPVVPETMAEVFYNFHCGR